MKSFNSITLVGELNSDVSKLGETAEFHLIVNRPYKSESGEKESDIFTVKCTGRLADICNEYLSKGCLVLIKGTLRTGLSGVYVSAESVNILQLGKSNEK